MNTYAIMLVLASLALTVTYLGLCYGAAKEVVEAHKANQPQEKSDYWVPMLAVGMSFGLFGGFFGYAIVSDVVFASLPWTGLNLPYFLGAGALGTVFSYWFMTKSVRRVIQHHYPEATFKGPSGFWIKELGRKYQHKQIWLNWLNESL